MACAASLAGVCCPQYQADALGPLAGRWVCEVKYLQRRNGKQNCLFCIIFVHTPPWTIQLISDVNLGNITERGDIDIGKAVGRTV